MLCRRVGGVSGAVLSQDGVYRYWLTRDGHGFPLLWLLLNPSTADAERDDPTVLKMRHFSGLLAFSAMNMYALRATDPRELWKHADPVGPDNDHYLDWVLSRSPVVICAWGTNAKSERVAEVLAIARRHGCKLFCLGVNKGGSPKHPLYLKNDTQFKEYSP